MVYPKAIIHANLLYEFRNHLKATEAAHRIRNAFDKDAVNDAVARFWFRRFATANETIENKPSQDRPETWSNEEIEKYLARNPRAICSEIGYRLNCDE